MESEIIKRRLVTGESVVPESEPSVSQCAKAFLQLQQESGSGCVSAQNTFLRELGLLELKVGAGKLGGTIEVCKKEMEYYQNLEEEIGKEIDATQQEINELRKRLGEERLTRQRKEECEMLAAKVNSETRRADTEHNIEEINRDLDALREKRGKVQEQFDLRKKQFQLLIHAIAELNQVLQ